MKKWVAVLAIFLLSIPLVFAAEMGDLFATPWCERPVIYFSHTASSNPSTYEKLLNYPEGGSEIVENITVKDSMGEVLIDTYISDPGYPNVVFLLGGLSRFRTYHYVSATPGITTINFSVSKRSIDGSQTFLWSVESQDINNLNVNEILTSHVTNISYAMLSTDRILINVSAKTTHSSNIQIYWFYQGENHASHVELGYFYCAAIPAGTKQMWIWKRIS